MVVRGVRITEIVEIIIQKHACISWVTKKFKNRVLRNVDSYFLWFVYNIKHTWWIDVELGSIPSLTLVLVFLFQ